MHSQMTQNESLYSFNECNTANMPLLFNPSKDDLIGVKNEELIVVFSHIPDDITRFLNIDNIKKILIFEYLEVKHLESMAINNFELILPASHHIALNKPKTKNTSCYTSLSDIKQFYLESLINFPLPINYYGHKVIKAKSDFKKLIDITYSKVKLKPYPIFNLEENIYETAMTIEQSYFDFPIISYFTVKNNNLPILYGSRFRRWILTELQNPTNEFISDLHTNDNLYSETVERQKELFNDYFKNHKRIEDAI